ncbi:MAG: hypothetical protein WC683_13585 [bacterium]
MPITFIPAVTVRIALTTDPFSDSPAWTDVSKDVEAIHIARGRFHELDRLEAATATIKLKNTSGAYWPANASGPHYGYLLPMKRVNIRATDLIAGTWDIYTGFIEAFRPGWESLGGKGAYMEIDCACIVKCLSRRLLNDGGGYAQELSSVRVENVLDDLGWNATERTIGTGKTTLLASGALANANAMSHLFSVQDTEMGRLFMAGNGYVIFQNREHRLTGARLISKSTWGDGVGECRYQKAEFSFDESFLYNDVRCTAEGGAEQVGSDAASVTAYGQRSLSRTGLLFPTDSEALDQANYLLSRYKDPFQRVKELTILPATNAGDYWTKVLSYEISDRITVRLSPAGIDADYYIEGVSHDCDMRDGIWTTKWQLTPAEIFTYWLLDTDQLDTGTRLSW